MIDHSKQKLIGHIVQNSIFVLRYGIFGKAHPYATIHGLPVLDSPCRYQLQ